jgi:hypothetical protein
MNEIRVQTARQYPQIISAIHHIHEAWKTSKPSNVIASFGHTHNKAQFREDLSLFTWKEISDLLATCPKWHKKEDWFIELDYQNQSDGWRISYRSGKVEPFPMTTGHHFDFRYVPQCPQDPSFSFLHDHTLRISFQPNPPKADSNKGFAFDHVRLRASQIYVIESSHVPNIEFEFRMNATWEGANMEAIEQAVERGNAPNLSICCQVKDVPSTLTDEQSWMVFLSLFLKMQDLMDLRMYQELLKDATIPSFLQKLPTLCPV